MCHRTGTKSLSVRRCQQLEKKVEVLEMSFRSCYLSGCFSEKSSEQHKKVQNRLFYTVMEQREVVCTVCILLVNPVYTPCGVLDPCAKVTTEKQRRKRPDTVRSVVGWIIEGLIWRREREGRDGLNSAPKTGCNTSDIHRHAENTHIQRHTHKRLVRGHVNGVAQSDSQAGRRGHTGVSSAQNSTV